MRELAARLWFTVRWYVGGGQSLATTWKASGVFVAAMRTARFRRLSPWDLP